MSHVVNFTVLKHIRLLRNLCEGVIDLSPLEGGASGLAENRFNKNILSFTFKCI